LAISTRVWPRSAASRFDSGSSNKKTFGARTIARPIATRWRCPPESSFGALQVGREVQDLGGAADLLLNHRLVDIGQAQRERHVVEHAHVRVERVALEHHRQIALARIQLGDVAPIEMQAAAVNVGQAGDHAQQRRFAAARGADEDDEFALLDREIDALDGAQRAEKLFDAFELQERHDLSPRFI
jgi:hypothetical protein